MNGHTIRSGKSGEKIVYYYNLTLSNCITYSTIFISYSSTILEHKKQKSHFLRALTQTYVNFVYDMANKVYSRNRLPQGFFAGKHDN